MQSIIFEDIHVNKGIYTFGYGYYGDFKVKIMKENGFIDATDLCKSGGKEFRSWKRIDYAAELIEETSKVTEKI